ncbi:ATP-grasp domain-containing protein [Pseudomonas sp. B21-054]|uniref:ATP-grasp domain-containing protein n=1 Tax=Pseudomonas sp. B21-054 TaxID=2895494 RepID=UPI002231F93F|nr:ATP-grasp domain-containing protein [Pseudomonas sp. B21-054]UZE18919.1 ATP-grasp domain-containing protein [Pseudomonas sp. B21-054]
MHLLYPSDPFDKKRPDEQYAEEYEAVMTAGLRTALFSFEDFEAGLFRTSAPLTSGDSTLYRGWMLTLDAYAALVSHLCEKGIIGMTDATQYRLCHHLPQWYPLLVANTSETVVLASDANFTQALEGLQWPGYFIKDYVKSLNTGSGSLVNTPEGIAPLVEKMRQYRGQIEGGICVRRREEYLEETERRYFVLHGQAYGVTDEVPELVIECARLIDSPFFSIDVALRSDGVLRVIELGDGQVSDRKEWSAERFAWMLSRAGEV